MKKVKHLLVIVAISVITVIAYHYAIKIWAKIRQPKQPETEIVEEDFLVVKKVFRPSTIKKTYTYWHDSVLRNIVTKSYPEELEMYGRKLAIEEFDTTLVQIPIKNREWFFDTSVGDTIQISKEIRVSKKSLPHMTVVSEPLKAIVKEITYFPETIEKNVQREIQKDGITRTEILDIYQQDYTYLDCVNLDGTRIVGHIHKLWSKKKLPAINDTIEYRKRI